MKGVVGVAGPRMSPASTAPLSNSRGLIKQPFTGWWGGGITAPCTQPLLPSLVRSSYRGHRAGDPPLPPLRGRNAGQTQEAEERTRWSEESNPSASRFSRQPVHCHRVGIQSSSCRGHLRPPRPNPKERLITGTTAPQCAQSCLAAHILIPLSEEETQFTTRS